MTLAPEEVKRYDAFAADSNSEGLIREELVPAHITRLQEMITAGLIGDPTIPRRGVDFECGRGPVTLAALAVFPNMHILGVDIDAERGYDILTDEERKRATFVHDAMQRFVQSPQEPFDVVLTGFVRIPDDLNYSSFAGLIKPNGLVVELYVRGLVSDYAIHEMKKAGFGLSRYTPKDVWASNVWRKTA